MSSQETQSIRQHKFRVDSDPEEEPKTYINFYFCKLSINILYSLTYVTVAVFLNIVNRLVFYKYYFNQYNYTFMLLQQIFCIIFFYIVSHKSQTFKSKAGEITFQDFYALKFYYFSFATVFMLNTIVIFIGTQMIINASMFQTLRKLVLVKVYFIDLFFGKKKITCFTSICVFMVTIGSVLAGVDTFSRDYLGIGLTMVSNFINVAYNKFTELFRKKTGVPNLKLLVYNSYISGPVLFLLIFITGEYKRLIEYFQEEKYLGENLEEGSFHGFVALLFISCTLCIILNSSFFMSNESNSSLFTQLMANTKDLFTCILSRFMLAGNKFTFNIVSGLVISTVGAMMFSMKSIKDNTIAGSISKKKVEPEEINISQDNNQPEQAVEIKTEIDSP
jgi:drug/metabolite transporter (DMT)-like permease